MELPPILLSYPRLISGTFITDVSHTIVKVSSFWFTSAIFCKCKNFSIRKAAEAYLMDFILLSLEKHL